MKCHICIGEKGNSVAYQNTEAIIAHIIADHKLFTQVSVFEQYRDISAPSEEV